jgi:hypothetical protein
LGLRSEPRRRRGKLLILGLTPRGLRRLRLDTARSSKIPAGTRSWNAALSSGGNSGKAGKFAANNSHGVNERKPVRVFIRLEGRFLHQAPDGEVSHQEAIELLAHQVRPLAAQDDANSPQVGFQFIQGRLNLPAFVVPGGQIRGRSLLGIEYRGGGSIRWPPTPASRWLPGRSWPSPPRLI